MPAAPVQQGQARRLQVSMHMHGVCPCTTWTVHTPAFLVCAFHNSMHGCRLAKEVVMVRAGLQEAPAGPWHASNKPKRGLRPRRRVSSLAPHDGQPLDVPAASDVQRMEPLVVCRDAASLLVLAGVASTCVAQEEVPSSELLPTGPMEAPSTAPPVARRRIGSLGRTRSGQVGCSASDRSGVRLFSVAKFPWTPCTGGAVGVVKHRRWHAQQPLCAWQAVCPLPQAVQERVSGGHRWQAHTVGQPPRPAPAARGGAATATHLL